MHGHHVSSPKAREEVDAMDEKMLLSFLLRSAMLDDSPSDLTADPQRAITSALYGLPLAIDQSRGCHLEQYLHNHDYLERYAIHHRELLMFPSFEGASDPDRAVYTTWDVSYMAIQADASGNH